jgi:hypothetical protein
LASSAIAVIKGGDAYRDNVFEREAFSVQFVENQHRLHVDIEKSKPH